MPHSVESINSAALFIHDRDDKENRFEGGLAMARTWRDAHLLATEGWGHRRILRSAPVVQSAIDFIADDVTFPRAADVDGNTAHASVEPVSLY